MRTVRTVAVPNEAESTSTNRPESQEFTMSEVVETVAVAEVVEEKKEKKEKAPKEKKDKKKDKVAH